jgi:hypothetical protein
MNDTSQSPFWNWPGWQVMKWITGIVILFGVLFMISEYNNKGDKWIEHNVNYLMDKQ